MKCIGCDNDIPNGVKFCPVCGARQPQPAPVPPRNMPPQPQYNGYSGNNAQACTGEISSPKYVDFGDAIKLFFINYVNFKGRSTRSEYWFAFLFTMIVYICCWLIDFVLPVKVCTTIAQMTFLVPTLSILFRRFHDTGRTGTFVIINYIVGLVWGVLLVVFGILALFAAFGADLSPKSIDVSPANFFEMFGLIGLFGLIPFGMNVYQIVVCCMPGEECHNKYGRAPF